MAATTEERLRRIWESPPGLRGFLGTVDHKEIGVRYMATALFFFLVAGSLALLMRAQLALPLLQVLEPETFNQFFSMHGTTMIFLFATPMLSGFANYLVPLMIGARDMAFPRLNAFSYWVFLLAGLFLYTSFLLGAVPDAGWFAYVPLTGPSFSPGPGLDFWVLGLIFLSVSTTAGAINLIVTIFKLRAPGMSANRLPVFVWAVLSTTFAIIFALPPLTVANLLLELDRRLGTHFYDPGSGGNPLLWQHLFWIFGHPDVYIIVLPALGIVSMVLPTFSRRPLVGYPFVALATVAIAMVSFGVWVHHMFATGLSPLGMAFFSAASFLVTIPSGVQIVAWLMTIWSGRPVLSTAMLFTLGFLAIFVLGGLTGVMFAAVPFDQQVTDSYFVVAHFHYVLIGGAVFPIFAGLYYWLPKIAGCLLDERAGQWSFWLMLVGFNLAFFPMHISGLLGMPRRVYTYPAGLGWEVPNLVSSIGAYIFALGILVTLWNIVASLRHGRPAGENPWQAGTLEWATTSPPPPYNFRTIPIVRGREPLWEPQGVGMGPALAERRVTLGTTVVEAEAEEQVLMPQDTLWPLAGAMLLAAAFVVLLADFRLGLVTGAVLGLSALAIWPWATTLASYLGLTRFRPAEAARPEDQPGAETSPIEALPVELAGSRSPGWWGMVLFIASEATLFASLLASYFYLRSGAARWPPQGIEQPVLLFPIIMTVVLVSSSGPMLWAEAGIRRGRSDQLALGLLLSFILGAVFLTMQAMEYSRVPFGLTTNAYGSLFFTITGLHGLHVLVGLGLIAVTEVRALLGHFNARRHLGVQVTALYWHFVDVVWLFILLSVYISPRLT